MLQTEALVRLAFTSADERHLEKITVGFDLTNKRAAVTIHERNHV